MEIEGLETEHVFQGRESIVLKTYMELKRWEPGDSYFEKILTRSSKEEIEKRWDDFVSASGKRGLKVEDKDMVCADFWADVSGNMLEVHAGPETFRNFATTNLGFMYSDGTEAEKIPFAKFYGVGVCGLVMVDDSYMLLGIRPDGRVDTVPAGFLEPGDLNQPEPFVYAFKREGRKNSVKPESARERDVLISEKWRNISAYLEGEVRVEKILEDYDLGHEKLLPRSRDLIYLKRKVPGEIKYKQVFLCPSVRLEEFAWENAKSFGERSAAILKRYFERI